LCIQCYSYFVYTVLFILCVYSDIHTSVCIQCNSTWLWSIVLSPSAIIKYNFLSEGSWNKKMILYYGKVLSIWSLKPSQNKTAELYSMRGRCGPDCIIVVGYITTYAISAYHHWSCEFKSRSGEVYLIQHYAIKIVRNLRQVGGFLSSTNKTGRQDITELLLNVALNTITLILTLYSIILTVHIQN
jgi:hypothetical protein